MNARDRDDCFVDEYMNPDDLDHVPAFRSIKTEAGNYAINDESGDEELASEDGNQPKLMKAQTRIDPQIIRKKNTKKI